MKNKFTYSGGYRNGKSYKLLTFISIKLLKGENVLFATLNPNIQEEINKLKQIFNVDAEIKKQYSRGNAFMFEIKIKIN